MAHTSGKEEGGERKTRGRQILVTILAINYKDLLYALTGRI